MPTVLGGLPLLLLRERHDRSPKIAATPPRMTGPSGPFTVFRLRYLLTLQREKLTHELIKSMTRSATRSRPRFQLVYCTPPTDWSTKKDLDSAHAILFGLPFSWFELAWCGLLQAFITLQIIWRRFLLWIEMKFATPLFFGTSDALLEKIFWRFKDMKGMNHGIRVEELKGESN